MKCLFLECNDGAIKLEGSSFKNRGRVEICMRGQWKTVCDDHWGAPEAQVVCKGLGYSAIGEEIFNVKLILN